MKNYIVFFFFSLLCFTSCKKGSTDDISPSENPSLNPPATEEIGTPPAAFTQKALIEFFTSANFGTCPSGLAKLSETLNLNSSKVYAACIHDADNLMLPQINTYVSNFGVNAYPSGMVNRIPSLGNVMLQPTQFQSNTNAALNKTAKCGLALNSSVNGTSLNIEVQVSFNTALSGNYNLTVYIVENEITGSGAGWDQKNNDNTNASSPYYQQGNPILNFKHNYVVRKYATPVMGEIIDASNLVAGGLLKKNYSVNIAGCNTAKVYIVAFVNKSGIDKFTHEVMNVQQAAAGSLKNWD